MKRDMDLIRTLLFEIERSDNGIGNPLKFTIDGVDKAILYGHLKMLDEAGLIEGNDFRGSNSSIYFPGRLTWAGHEFLDAVRDANIWKKTLRKLSETSGSASLDIVKALAVSFVQQQLGLSS
jgi:predicted transcriptional regulator